MDKDSNKKCANCAHTCDNWADVQHAIFLCLDCAAIFKELNWATDIRNVRMDDWNKGDIDRMEKGGNENFTKFLRIYGM